VSSTLWIKSSKAGSSEPSGAVPRPGDPLRLPLGTRVRSRTRRGNERQAVLHFHERDQRWQRARRVGWFCPSLTSSPSNPADAVEIPVQTKNRLGLDTDRSWIVITEANELIWPGPDQRPIPGEDASSISYGPLPLGCSLMYATNFLLAIEKTLHEFRAMDSGQRGRRRPRADCAEQA
jgi:hypothetical protein